MRFLLGATGLALALDIASKIWIRDHIAVGGRIDLLPGWIHLQHVRNYGAAWSIMAGHTTFLILFTLAVIGLLIYSAREITRQGPLAATAYGLILGGALGNFFDRAIKHYVTDFFDLDTPVAWIQTFPVFNVADCALTVGVILISLATLLNYRRSQRNTPRPLDADVLTKNGREGVTG